MPIAAIASIGMGASAIAAGGLSTFGMITAVSGIVGGIGALTGNKELTMLGGIGALAGGIGSFAAGKGWIASGGTNSALNDTGNNIGMLKSTVAPGLDSAQDFGQAAGSNNIELGLMDSPTPAAAVAAETGGLPTGIAGNLSGTNPLVQNTPAQSSVVQDAMGQNTKANMGSFTQKPGGSVFDTIRKFGDLLPQDKETRAMLMNFIGGAFDSRKQAETDWLKARTDETRAQMKNGSDIPSMNGRLTQRGPVFPATRPTYNPPRIGGLMNAG